MLPNNKQRWLNKWVLTLAAVVVSVSVLSGCGKKQEKGTEGQTADVVATYKDGGKVTRAEFDSFVGVNKMFNPQLAQYMQEPAFQQDMLKQLITFRVLSSRADDKTKAEADKQVEAQMTQLKDYLGKMEGGLDKQLKDNNVKIEDVEGLMKMSFYTMMTAESKVTDQQIKEVYDKNAAEHAYDIATVSHILIGLKDPASNKDVRTKEEALKRANEVLDKLNKGGDFAALAKEYSDDPGSKDNGGTYKDADINQWVPGFKKAAMELPVNKISDPVETEFGYHIMKVESRSAKKLDDVKTDIRSDLANTSVSEFAEKELPGLIESNNLPKPEDQPAASAAPSPSPAAK